MGRDVLKHVRVGTTAIEYETDLSRSSLKDILEVGCEGSTPLATLCGKQVDLLKNSPVDLAAVRVNPFDDNAARRPFAG